MMRHAAGLRRMLQIGTPIEFSLEVSDYDETDDTFSNERILVVKGHAVQLDGDPIEYRDLGLTKKDPVTLLFMPDKIGDEPDLESQVKWADKVRTVKHILPFRPSGQGIGAKVIAS